MRHLLNLVALLAGAQAAHDPTSTVLPLPRDWRETVNQAIASCKRALAVGERRMSVELLLPLIGATDLDDWPGGVRQMYSAAEPMVRSLLTGLDARTAKPRVLDGGDACVAYESPTLNAVVFPTAEALGEVKRLAGDANGNALRSPLILINPQWRSRGQIISDFGIGPWKAANEMFVASFVDVYSLTQMRISGVDVRMLHAFPGGWQVIVASTGTHSCIAVEPTKPTYKRIEHLLDAAGLIVPIQQRLQNEFRFNRDSLGPPPPGRGR